MTFPTTRARRTMLAAAAAVLCALTATGLAQRGAMTPELAERRWALEKELASVAVIERKVMLPMRDGVRLPRRVTSSALTRPAPAKSWARSWWWAAVLP